MSSDKSIITLSVVSHQQEALVKLLFDDLENYLIENIKVILTLNIEESLSFDINHYRFPIDIIRNQEPKGFGENHNQAFTYCDSPYFCVINPDVRLISDPFATLISQLNAYDAALIAPLV